MNISNNTLAFALFFLVSLSVRCDAQNWERFRGPNGSGVALEAKLPTNWSEEDYAWRVELAGEGSSSPVVWDDKVFLMSSRLDGTLILQCLNLETGEQHWDQEFQSGKYQIHRQNSFASSSPAVDAKHVYVTYADPDHTMLVALDHAGNPVWKRDFGRWVSQHGFGMSPMVYEDKVIFCNSQQAQRVPPGQKPGKSEVIAVSCETGEDVWRAPLTATRACYALPCIYSVEGKPDQLIGTNTGEGFYSLDPKTGARNWATEAFQMRTVASTFTVDGLIFGSNGTGGGGNYLVAARPGESGAEELYKINKSANYVPSPIAVDHLLFLFGDKGIVSCLDLKTGNEHWRQRVARGFSGSPVANATHVYCMDQNGSVAVIEVNTSFKLTSLISLGESSRATPAIVGNRILFRTKSHLVALSGDK